MALAVKILNKGQLDGIGHDVVPVPVIKAICEAWPDQAVAILDKLRFAGDHYSFERWGMYVGVEFDGHIHT